MARCVVLLSGGMDSATVLWHARAMDGVDVDVALSFDYGSKHNAREIPMAVEQAEAAGVGHVIIPLGFIERHFASDLLRGGGDIPRGHYAEESMRRTVVPFRNGILLAVAAGLAESRGADGLVIAAHAGDHAIYPDCREDFMRPMAEAVEAGTYARVRLLRPFIDWSKADIVRRGTELGVDFGSTWSCYVGGDVHCGQCGTCVERREAFHLAGVRDPTAYAAEPPLPRAP